MDQNLALFHKTFKQVDIVKHNYTLKNMIITGIANTLSPRTSKTSPIDKDSPLYNNPKISALKDLKINNKAVYICLVDLPIFTVDDVFASKEERHFLKFCAISKETNDMLSLVEYEQIEMFLDTTNSLGIHGTSKKYTSSCICEVFLNIPTRNKEVYNEFNTNKFVFIYQNGNIIRKSDEITIQSWNQAQRILRSSNQHGSNEEIYNRIVSIVTAKKDDRKFLVEVDAVIQKMVKNSIVTTTTTQFNNNNTTKNNTANNDSNNNNILTSEYISVDLPPLFPSFDDIDFDDF